MTTLEYVHVDVFSPAPYSGNSLPVFTDAGGYGSPQAYVDGLIPAIWVGAAVLAVGALIALFVPRRPAAADLHELREPARVEAMAA